MQDRKIQSLWIDNIKALALVGVIFVHVAGVATATEYNPASSTNSTWWIANIYDSFFRICVPLFVMITGTLLLPQKQIPLNQFLKKRLNRILWPFIFWTFIYIAFKIALGTREQESVRFSISGSWLIAQLLNGAWPHLWYVYMIISLYLFIPIIKPWLQSASNKAILYFLVIWLITIILNQQKVYRLDTLFDFRYFSGYMGYLILGYYLSERLTVNVQLRKAAVIAILIGYVITLEGTFLTTKISGEFSHEFYEYLTVNVLLMSVGVFILLKNCEFPTANKTINALRKIVSRYGFGIYLGHGLVLSILIHFKIYHNLINPWLGIPVTSFLCLLITTLLIYLLDKLPFGKYISG